MSSKIPATHVDLLEGPYFAVLTTMAPSGQPENTVVWCSWDGEHVLVNTADGRRKPDNVRKNPKVALTRRMPSAGSTCAGRWKASCLTRTTPTSMLMPNSTPAWIRTMAVWRQRK